MIVNRFDSKLKIVTKNQPTKRISAMFVYQSLLLLLYSGHRKIEKQVLLTFFLEMFVKNWVWFHAS